MDPDDKMTRLTIAATKMFADADAPQGLDASLASPLDNVLETKPKPKTEGKLKPKAKATGKGLDNGTGKELDNGTGKELDNGTGKGKAAAPAAVMPALHKLRSGCIVKRHKGGRMSNQSFDEKRRELVVPIYPEGVLKGMWKINPLGLTTTPQATKIFHAMNDLIADKNTVSVYSAAHEIGHPWFTQIVDTTTLYLDFVTITTEQHFEFWAAVCGSKANVKNLQSTINKIVISAGFSQEVLQGTDGKITFKFDSAKWKAATSLLRNGVGGGGNSPYQGRPSIVVADSPAAD